MLTAIVPRARLCPNDGLGHTHGPFDGIEQKPPFGWHAKQKNQWHLNESACCDAAYCIKLILSEHLAAAVA